MKRSSRKYWLDFLTYLALIAGAVIMVLPFIWMISVSFRTPANQWSHNVIPSPATLANFVELWTKLPDQAFPYLTWNSFKITSLITVGQILTCAMAAFVFAVVRFRGRTLLFTLLLITLMIPVQVTLIPNFILFRYARLIGTQLPLIIPAFWGGAFGTFLLRQYFLTIPRELAEAVVDGTRREFMETLTTVPLLIIDDLGMRKLPLTAAEDLLEVIMRRYERASTLLTSNRPVEDWGKLLGDVAAVTAMLDRILHHGHVLKCGPRSWRTKASAGSAQ